MRILNLSTHRLLVLVALAMSLALIVAVFPAQTPL